MCLSDFEHSNACSCLDYFGWACVKYQGSHNLMNVLMVVFVDLIEFHSDKPGLF